MLELTGKAADVSFDYLTGKTKLTLEINEKQDLISGFDELKEKDKLAITLKAYRKKRSLDANSYFWVLLGKLAAKTK